MTVYAKIENNKLITAYNGYNGITGLADSPTLCEASGFTAYTEEEVSGYYAGTHQIIDGALEDISGSTEYINSKRLIAIEEELKKADSDYATVLSTPVVYPVNGLTYKPSYVDSYALLIVSGMGPFTIWDSTEFNGTLMTAAELTGLAIFLKKIAEPAFQARKDSRKKLLTEKAEILNRATPAN